MKGQNSFIFWRHYKLQKEDSSNYSKSAGETLIIFPSSIKEKVQPEE